MDARKGDLKRLRRPRRILAVVVATGMLLVVQLGAQDWRGGGRLSGVVLDPAGSPVVDAEVAVRPQASAEGGPPAARTDGKGRWAVGGLAIGRWTLEIKAEGFSTATGWADVGAAPRPPVRVEMRPLSEVSPAFTEGHPATVRGWLDKGNVLLDQGQHAAARAEYEKALRVLEPEEKAVVYRSVARAYFLEQDVDGAVASMRRALLLAPADEDSRALYGALMGELGRADEATTWLARLDAEGPDALAEPGELDPAPRAVPRIPDIPVEAPAAHRRGRYRTGFAEPSPLSATELFLERFGLEAGDLASGDPAAGAYSLADETFEVFVPESYAPDAAFGLVVWISPTPYGGMRRNDLLAALADERLIWIGANHAGNRRAKWYRLWLALDAAHNMDRLYHLDSRRIYVAGYSGGGRLASTAAILYPEAFRGGFSLFGVDYFRKVPVPDKPGASWAAAFPAPPRGALREVRAKSRFALLTGEHDFNRGNTKATYRAMEGDGFAHVDYLEIPGATHYQGLDGEWFSRGIERLDAPLAAAP